MRSSILTHYVSAEAAEADPEILTMGNIVVLPEGVTAEQWQERTRHGTTDQGRT